MQNVWRKKSFFSISLLLAAILLLGGCRNAGQESGETGAQETGTQETAFFCEEGSPMTEYVVPDWETSLRETVGEDRITAQGSPVLYRGGISQLVNDITEYRAYQQTFSMETGKWTAVSRQDEFEKDGAAYSGIRDVFPSLDGNLYCLVFMEEEKLGLAVLGVDGVEEIFTDKYMLREQLNKENTLLDASGRLISYQNSGYQYDAEGAYSASVSFFDEELQKQGDLEIAGWVLGGIQADAQSPFYLYGYDEVKQPCLWTTDGEKRLLEGLKELDYQAVYAESGILYITDRNSIWAMEKEEPRELYHYGDHGYYLNTLYGMCRGGDQTLQILAECDGDLLLLIYDLTKQDFVSSKQEITLALGLQNVGLEEVIARFNRRSSQYSVTVMLPEQGEDPESFRSRIQMELAAGRGPDLLGDDIFTDMEALVKNCYVECLDGQGFEELGCLEGALEVSMAGQKLYGIPYDFSLDFAAYRASDMEGEDSLTMEKLMDKVRSSEAKILQKVLAPGQLILKYALSDRSNKDYIDWEKGESHLTDKPFLELLEFAREYGNTGMNTALEAEDIYADGTLPGTRGMTSFAGFNNFYEVLGTDISVLGYPRSEGYGIYLDTRAIYLSSQSGKKEGAIAFLKYLISEEAQTRYALHDYSKEMYSSGESFWMANRADFPVNASALEALMTEEFGERPDAQWIEEEAYQAMTYTEKQRQQFIFLVENAHPALNLGEIAVIMEEELAPYFEGTKTAEEVVEILNRRVQLYLDERK